MNKYTRIIVLILVIGAISVGGYYYIRSSRNKASEDQNKTAQQSNNSTSEGQNNQIQNAENNQGNTDQSGNTPADTQTTTKDGDITVGQITSSNSTQIQDNVNSGNQPWRTDPLQVAEADGGDYGFTLSDQYDFLGTTDSVAKVRVGHQGKNYIIELTQPEKKGSSGIWAIKKIYTE
jgi:cytoskeletal protein RodZ